MRNSRVILSNEYAAAVYHFLYTHKFKIEESKNFDCQNFSLSQFQMPILDNESHPSDVITSLSDLHVD